MFSLEDRPTKLCDGISRRDWLRAGGLSVLGLSLPSLLASEARSATVRSKDSPLSKGLQGTTFGRAKNVIYLWLQGGPPQHETFDPKPDAPAEIRGQFKPIATNVPGIRFCELLPRTARIADKLAIVRGMVTKEDDHARETLALQIFHHAADAFFDLRVLSDRFELGERIGHGLSGGVEAI